MQYYVGRPGNTHIESDVWQFIIKNDLFVMDSAVYRYHDSPFVRYAMDNGAYTYQRKGLEFNHKKYLKILDKMRNRWNYPEFIVLPDVLGDGVKSLELSSQYMYLHDEFTLYLPIHAGLDVDEISGSVLDKIDGVFFGGVDSVRNKNVIQYTNFCHDYGLKVHVGRVGSLSSYSLCHYNKVDSCDSAALIYQGIIKEDMWNKFMVIKNNEQSQLSNFII